MAGLLIKLADSMKEKGIQVNEKALTQSLDNLNHVKSTSPDYDRGKKMVRHEIELQCLGKESIVKHVMDLCLLPESVVEDYYKQEKFRFELMN